jgi:hypothetical protein
MRSSGKTRRTTSGKLGPGYPPETWPAETAGTGKLVATRKGRARLQAVIDGPTITVDPTGVTLSDGCAVIRFPFFKPRPSSVDFLSPSSLWTPATCPGRISRDMLTMGVLGERFGTDPDALNLRG